MPAIRPFRGIHYARRADLDPTRLIAPPYDVLDEKARTALQRQHPNNIVNIDLPHLPPKTLGPDHVYEQAATTLRAWLDAGILVQDARPALYPYSQSYSHTGRTFHRRGFIALVRLAPFDAGEVVPHEKTHKGPIEDRLKLMQTTAAQLSPIFGLFSDPKNEITNLLYHELAKPMLSGTLDGVQNDLWTVRDAEIENQVIDLMRGRPVYIADGHHRYTTALQYQKDAQSAHGGPLPPNHPANWCMFMLISMQDPGLLILPTHRLVGGLDGFDIDLLRAEIGEKFTVTPSDRGPDSIGAFADQLAHGPRHTFGLYDGRSRRLFTLTLNDTDVLRPLEPQHSDAWRRLDVAILHRYLLDEVIQPTFGSPGKELQRGYSADAVRIPEMVNGSDYQIALLLQATPLTALEELARSGEVMPQKSTYFYPKLATGLVVNPLNPEP